MKKKRILAFLIDMIIIAVLTCLISYCLILIPDKSNIPNVAMLISIFACILIVCKDCYNGTSIGKYLMNIQIRNVKDQLPASPLKCVIRDYMYFVWSLEIIVFLCTKGDRIGDYITCTKVMEGIEYTRKVQLQKIFITVAIVMSIFIGMYLYMNFSGLSP